MSIGRAEQRKIEEHFADGMPTCITCGPTSWEVQDELIGLPLFDTEYKRVIEGKLSVVVMMTCRTCGYAAMFSAAKLGLAG